MKVPLLMCDDIVYYIIGLFVICVLPKVAFLSCVGWTTLFCPPFIIIPVGKKACPPYLTYDFSSSAWIFSSSSFTFFNNSGNLLIAICSL
jgi:hypothetical protein